MVFNDIYDMTQEENIFCAKRTLVDAVYKAANLEGIAVTFAQTTDIINNINVASLTPTEINKVCCLKDGWEYLLNNLNKPLDLVFLEELHEIVARFDVPYSYLGKLRTEDVIISGTSWRPTLPNADLIHSELLNKANIPCITERAIKTGLWLMKTQPFKDGNKRIGSFAINKILIENGKGLFNVAVEKDGIFKELLVKYYEDDDLDLLTSWCFENCLEGTTKANNLRKIKSL